MSVLSVTMKMTEIEPVKSFIFGINKYNTEYAIGLVSAEEAMVGIEITVETLLEAIGDDRIE